MALPIGVVNRQLSGPTAAEHTRERIRPGDFSFWGKAKRPKKPKKQQARPAGQPPPKAPSHASTTSSSFLEERGRGSESIEPIELPANEPVTPNSSTGRSSSCPKHVPIIVPIYLPIAPDSPSVSSTRTDSISALSATSGEALSISDFAARKPSTDSGSSKHVVIKIPSWAQPFEKQKTPPPKVDITQSTFFLPFEDCPELTPDTMSRPTADSSRANTMDSNLSAPSPTRPYSDQTNSASRGSLPNINSSSQLSLGGGPNGYESAPEAESAHDDPPRSGSHMPSQSQSLGQSPGTQPVDTPGNNTGNLSGLVCNVHRTTGKEPPPLVGATTTILGDKLYVFGGRRLSRKKPQLTSTLYELDLIRRHWTKLETRGDIPPPRYFHSVCALGDTKLVCYGGMSPSVSSPTSAQQANSQDMHAEVIVMSDIHIFDAVARTWLELHAADSPQGRYAHCAAVLPSSAIFSSMNAVMSAVHHNPTGSNPNQGSLGVSLDGAGGAEMVVVGGQDSANHYIEQISIFNLRSLKWTGTTTVGRSCGAYRSVVTPLTTMTASQIGAGPHYRNEVEEDEEEPPFPGSGAPMLIYSNYNFLDVKLELQVRLTDGTMIEKPMQTAVSPPGLRFPNGGIIDNHFIVSGTFLTSSKQEYALWALDLRTLTWSRIDAGGSIFGQGSWNRGVLWSRRNSFVILGNRKRSLVDDYNNRRINFSNICIVELEAFGLYNNARKASPNSGFVSISAPPVQALGDATASGRQLTQAAEDLGVSMLGYRELADMDFISIDGRRVPVNSRLIARRWGPNFISLLRESVVSQAETDTMTLRPSNAGHPSRNSSVTITPSVNSMNSGTTTLTNNTSLEVPDARYYPPPARPGLLYLPHTLPTLHALLYYLYTSALPSHSSALATPQIFCSLLQVARPYKIDGLLEAVAERLHESLDGRNAAAIFNAAAMSAGGGEGVVFAPGGAVRESGIPLRSASLLGLEGLTINGTSRGTASLRIDTDMANGRETRNTIRPDASGQRDDGDELSEDDVPLSASTTDSMSSSESALSLVSGADRSGEVWNGALSSVVGLQKRGLRGLMEGRRLRERGRGDGAEGAKIGLGIA